MAWWRSAAIDGGLPISTESDSVGDRLSPAWDARMAAGQTTVDPSPSLCNEFGIPRGTAHPVGAFRHVPGGLKPHYLPLKPMRVPVPVGLLAVANSRRQVEYKREWCDAA